MNSYFVSHKWNAQLATDQQLIWWTWWTDVDDTVNYMCEVPFTRNSFVIVNIYIYTSAHLLEYWLFYLGQK